jgi:uncharacterized protein (DUF433 family)
MLSKNELVRINNSTLVEESERGAMRKVEIGNYLVIDPEICHGQMTFKGTRVPVDTVLTFLAKGYSVDQLLRSWPELTQPAVEEAISLASQSLQTRYSALLEVATEVIA